MEGRKGGRERTKGERERREVKVLEEGTKEERGNEGRKKEKFIRGRTLQIAL